MNFPDHGAVNAYTGFLLRKVSSASFNAFSEIVGAHGLHPMHLGMLTFIDAPCAPAWTCSTSTGS